MGEEMYWRHTVLSIFQCFAFYLNYKSLRRTEHNLQLISMREVVPATSLASSRLLLSLHRGIV